MSKTSKQSPLTTSINSKKKSKATPQIITTLTNIETQVGNKNGRLVLLVEFTVKTMLFLNSNTNTIIVLCFAQF